MAKTKLLSIFLLTVILSAAFILAAIASPSTLTFTDDGEAFNVSLSELTENATYDIVASNFNSNVPITFKVSGDDVNMDGDELDTTGITTSTVNIEATTDHEDLEFGVYKGDITFTEQGEGDDSVAINIEFVRSFCSEGEQGEDLEIRDIDIKNKDGDDEEWSPQDSIEIDVEVENNGDGKIRDIFVEIALFDSEGKDVTNDLEFRGSDDEEIDLGSIGDNDEKTATFEFDIPSDFEDDNYKLFIKTYSDDLGEDIECTAESDKFEDGDFFTIIDGERETDEDKHIIFDNIKVSPSPAQCNDIVQITGELFNVGDEDYEDQVRVTLDVKDLGISQDKIVRENFDEGDSELVDFEFEVPEDAEEKIYLLEFKTFYEYDEDDDTYDLDSDETFIATFRVGGNCQEAEADAMVLISARLDPETPEAFPGKQVIVNTNLRNTGDTEATYTVSVLGNTAWSNLISIDPQVITLGPGESRDLNIVLSVKDDAQGDNELIIRATSGTEVTDQIVALSIAEGKARGDAELGPFVNHIKDNWFIYVIVLVNIVLIIAIILVIRSMVSPRPL